MNAFTKEDAQKLGDAIDAAIQNHTQDDNIHFCLMVINVGVQPVRAITVSSLPRNVVLKLWQDEIDGKTRVTVEERGGQSDN